MRTIEDFSNQTGVPIQIVKEMCELMKDWSDEKQELFIECSNTEDWTPFREKYGGGPIEYKSYEPEIASIKCFNFNGNMEASDAFFKDKL